MNLTFSNRVQQHILYLYKEKMLSFNQLLSSQEKHCKYNSTQMGFCYFGTVESM